MREGKREDRRDPPKGRHRSQKWPPEIPRSSFWNNSNSTDRVCAVRLGWRDGPEKGRSLGGKKEERRKKREERDKHDRDDRVEGGNGSVPEGRYGREKGW